MPERGSDPPRPATIIDLCRALRHDAAMLVASYILLLVSAIGTCCLMIAAGRAWRLGARAPAVSASDRPVTLLKPLHGAEPALLANLTTFVTQANSGPLQMICGVQNRADPAIAAVEALRAAHPDADISLVVDPTRHGSNAKISNLTNMVAHARHDLLILSDSDMAVAPDYIARIIAALDAPGVAAVTCLYRGRGDAGRWSRLAAMGISQHFLPSILLGTALGLASPCMGSTIALRRETLDAIGGMAAFADLLADDYAMGAAIRAQGGRIALPDMLLAHGCVETSFATLARRELRANRTIARLDPAGFAGSVILHPLPFALAGGLLTGFAPAALTAIATIAAALGARLALALLVDRAAGERTAPLWWIPARDLLSFVLFLATFFGRSVDWRGASFTVDAKGLLSAQQDKRS